MEDAGTFISAKARMHYGHPDIMNQQYMMQQGGVSKGTKTLNLSEDIFAGMDFTLRGEGRQIKHCEYMHMAKGRDLGFKSVLGFFSKVSSGAGEQVITRQFFRLGNVLVLPEMLTCWYAHVGYYMNQFLIPLAMCQRESNFYAFCYDMMEPRAQGSALVFAELISTWFSVVMLVFVFATILPLYVEVWYERSFKIPTFRVIKQLATLSPLLLVFQAKIIGYVMNELRHRGATYCATGRGLPTERIPFVGKCLPGSWKLDSKRTSCAASPHARRLHKPGSWWSLCAINVELLGAHLVLEALASRPPSRFFSL